MNLLAAVSKLVGAAISIVVWGVGLYLTNEQIGACSSKYGPLNSCNGWILLIGIMIGILGFCSLVYCVGRFQSVRNFFAD